MPSLVNRLVSSELTRELGKAEGLIFISFAGLTVKEAEALRNKMAAKGVRVRMLRNALARRVLAERGIEIAEGVLVGNTALAWGSAESAIHAAKVAAEPDVKKSGKVKVRGGVLDGRWLSDKDAAGLAKVPDRKTLQAQLLGCLSGPARGLVATLNGLPGGLARVLDARAKVLETQGGATAAASGEASEKSADAAASSGEAPEAGGQAAGGGAPA